MRCRKTDVHTQQALGFKRSVTAKLEPGISCFRARRVDAETIEVWVALPAALSFQACKHREAVYLLKGEETLRRDISGSPCLRNVCEVEELPPEMNIIATGPGSDKFELLGQFHAWLSDNFGDAPVWMNR